MITSGVIQHQSGFIVVQPGESLLNVDPNKCVQAVNGNAIIDLVAVDNNGQVYPINTILGTDIELQNGHFIYGNFTAITVQPASVGSLLVYLR